MALSIQQLAQIDLQAGWPAALVPQAVAIQEAESGGNPGAVNRSSGAAGLFQIFPAQPGSLDPLTNARQAWAKYQSQGWGAWAASRGVWSGTVGAVTAALGNLANLGAVNPLGNTSNPLNIGQGISGAVTSTGHGLANAGQAVGHNAATWAKNNIVGLVVALVVALVLFGGGKSK